MEEEKKSHSVSGKDMNEKQVKVESRGQEKQLNEAREAQVDKEKTRDKEADGKEKRLEGRTKQKEDEKGVEGSIQRLGRRFWQ